MAESSAVVGALLKIKQEPVDAPHFGWTGLTEFAACAPDLADVEKMVNNGQQPPGLISSASRARIRAANPAPRRRGRGSAQAALPPEDYDTPADEVQNSDEEAARRARRAEYVKASQATAKRARRKADPPDEWKGQLDRERTDNIMLDDTACLRMQSQVEFISPVHNPVHVDDDMMVTVEDEADGGASALKRTRSGVPLSKQPGIVYGPPVLRAEVRKRLDAIASTSATDANALVPIYAVNAALRHATTQEEEQREREAAGEEVMTVVVPAGFDLSDMSVDRVMQTARTDDQGQVFAQMHMQTTVCNYEDTTYVTRKLKITGIYNCPLSRVGMLDDYYAHMVPNRRVVDESLMREPFPFERPCIEAGACMGNQIPNSQRITLVEYLNVEDVAYFRQKQEWKSEQRHCVFCRRVLATKAAFAMIAECAAYSDSMVASVQVSRENPCESDRRPLMLVDFCNFVGDNEYSPYDVVISNVNRYIGVVAPVVIFVASRFTQFKQNGIYWYRQDYPKVNRNLRDWGTLVSEELSRGTQSRVQTAPARRPRRIMDYFLPPPPLDTGSS